MTRLLFTCALPLSCDRCCLLQYCLHSHCFCVTGRPLRRTSVKETACEAIITQLRPDKARHSTPQPCQSARLDTGRRANAHKTAYVSDRKEKKKKRCCSEEIYTFPCHSAFPPFPLSCLRKASSQNTCSRILTCLSSACFADRSETDSLF